MKKGQALIETLIAVSVLTVGFLGLVSLLTRSLGLNRVVAENYAATYLAAEGAEVVKNILDTNTIKAKMIQGLPWQTGVSDGEYEVEYGDTKLAPFQNRVLKFNPDTKLYSYSGPESANTRFRRTITIDTVSADEVKVSSKVEWVTRGGGRFDINIEDHFFNWRKYANE